MGGKRKRPNNKTKKQPQKPVEEEEEEVVVAEVVAEEVAEQVEGKEDSEDYCFVCKDGGLLIVCDHKECVKAYHLGCVGKKEDDEEENWICGWHTCLVCRNSPKYQCYCCPNATCQHCYKDAAFAKVRGNKGFCHDCLRLALLGEEGLDVDSDGEKVDFKDRETYEGLFKEYWDIIKEKEGLVLEDLHRADVKLQKGEDYIHIYKSHSVSLSKNKSNSDSEEYVNKEEEEEEEKKKEEKEELKGYSSEDRDIDNVVVQPSVKSNAKKAKRARPKGKGSKRIEFMGWASKSLTEFLESIGVDASKKMSQHDVATRINAYAQENKLIHPEKKKVVLCDVRLRCLFARKSFNMYKINDALEPHFAENLDKSEDEGYSSGCEEDKASLSTKKEPWWRKPGIPFQNKGSLMEKYKQKEAIPDEPFKKDPVVEVVYSRFATIAPRNMKLVYLRRTLVEQLLEDHESKVLGSFVKVKSDPFNSKNQHLLLVTGVKKDSDDANNKILLQVSSMPNDIPISLLSNDDDISQEECENLCQKVEDGLVEKPTVVELEEKAKCLHEDITKHWISRELSVLQNRIDLANEKGRRAELYELRKRRDLLQSEEEQGRLLKEVPKVIADIVEIKPEEPQPDDNPKDDLENPIDEFTEKRVLPDQYF